MFVLVEAIAKSENENETRNDVRSPDRAGGDLRNVALTFSLHVRLHSLALSISKGRCCFTCEVTTLLLVI